MAGISEPLSEAMASGREYDNSTPMRKINAWGPFLMGLLILSLSFACSKEDRLKVDQELIENFLAENQIEAELHSSGLYYRVEEGGSGDESPDINSLVQVAYTGYLLSGSVFDQSPPGNPPKFLLQNVIRGWQEGIPLFKKGGKGTLYIPSTLGYGNMQVGPIPPNSVLIFEIELIDFWN